MASKAQAQQVAALTSLTVYNLDTDELLNILRPFLMNNKNIQGLLIIDALSQERLFQFYQSDTGSVYNQNIPPEIMRMKSNVADVLYNNGRIAAVTVYATARQTKSQKLILFTQEEQAWLAQNIPIRYVFDPDWKPFEWKNAIGKHEGILADILGLMKEKSNLNLVPIATDSWADSIQTFKAQKVDMFSGIGVSNERKEYVNFTARNIFSVPYVVITKSTALVNGQAADPKQKVLVELFKSHKVGVVEDYAIMGMLAEKVPHQTLVLSKSINEGLQRLMDGDIDYFVLNKVTAKSYLYQPKFKALYSLGELEGFNLNLKVAIRKDWPPVVLSILDKTMAAIPDQKITEIYQKWAPKPADFIQEHRSNNDRLSLMVQVTGGFIAITVLVLFALWFIKGRPKELSIKHTLILIFFVLTAMILTTAVLVSILLKSETSLQSWQEKNSLSISLMQELRQSSDDLTRFVRMYVLTQDQKYKQYFQMVLDIRNGVVAHPENYSFSYWDEVLGQARQIDHKGSSYNLKERAQQLEFTRLEMDLLMQAYLESEALAKIEQQAMTLVEKKVLNTKGGGNNVNISNLERAKNLVFNQSYHEQKSLIMRPLSDLKTLLTLRLNNHFNDVFMQHNAILSTIAIFVIMMVLFSVYAYLLLSRRIIKPLELFKHTTQKIQQGEYTQTIQLSNQDEMGQLAESFNRMSKGIASRTQEIQNNHDFTQALLDSEEQMVVTLGKEGGVKSCNRAFLQFYDVTHLSEFIEQYHCLSDTFDRTVSTGHLHPSMEGVHWSEYVINHPNTQHRVQIMRQGVTSIFSVSVAELPVFGEHSDAVKSAVFTDITELEQQKKQTEAVISGFMYPVIITEKTTGLIVYANQFALSQFELLSESQLIGTTVSRFYADKVDQQNILIIFETNGVLDNYELRYKTEKNHYFDALLKLQSIIFDGKECIMGVVVDVSQQKEQQRALEEAQSIIASEMADRKQSETLAKLAKKQLENMTNSIPGAVFQFQRNPSNGVYQMTFISQNIQTLQGVSSRLVQSDFNLFLDSILEADRSNVLDCFNASYTSLKPIQIEYRVPLNAVTQIWIRLEATVSVVDEGDGKPLNTVVNGSLMDITTEKQAKLELHRLHKHTRDSIEYAALIQQAIIPDDALFLRNFSDYFALWRPKDIVGGDIYLFETLRHKDECLLMVIDCAGHGVPGAFVTMLVKAIEREIEALIIADPEMEVSPAWILSYFNKTMKMLLKQNHVNSISNAGFDGGIVYYNQKENILKFSGAETSLFYIDDGVLHTIKGNRHSVGYKKSDNAYPFTEHTIPVKKGMQFYVTTDGYFDQNGGIKGFPYGKKRFGNSLLQHADKPFKQQEAFLVQCIETYQGREEQNDDICMVGFKI
jgi:serine phosphatase RsbU (regulator of sigma subunit)/ABC-type amino acid transport substrate-binding protein/signal transduction histidine kinase